MPLEQFIGFLPDATVGGTPLDALVSGTKTNPQPTMFFPITEANPEKNQTQTDRNDEIRGDVDEVAPLSFREASTVTVQGRLYPYVAKRLLKLATGAADVRTGGVVTAGPPTTSTATTHKLVPIGFGANGLPACHIVIVRDNHAELYAGCQIGQLTFRFPIDGEATWEAQFLALYRTPLTAYTPPAESYANVEEWVYMLRDTDVFLDGASTALDALRGIEFTVNNQFRDPEFWPKRHREIVTDGGVKHIVWHPARRKRGTRRSITGRLMFSDAKPLQDRRQDLARAQRLVMETEAQDLPASIVPAAKELLRFTGQRTVWTGGGISNMTRDSDVTSDYEFGVYRDQALGQAAVFEFVDDKATDITFAP